MRSAEFFHSLRKRKIVRAAIFYLAAAWGFAQVVEFVVDNYDISRRLLDVTILLLVLGFPAVLIIAWYHGEKGRQRMARTEVSLLLTLGVLAAIGTYRLSSAGELPGEGGGEPAAFVSSGDLGAGSLAVLPFTNTTGADSLDWLGPGLSDMLTTNLARQAGLRVVSPQRLFEILQDEGRSETDRIPQELAISVASRSGARRMVRGTILGRLDDLILDVQLIELADGTVAAGERVRGGDAFALVDSVAARLVPHLATEAARPPASLAALSPLPGGPRRSPLELTGDLEAYRGFLGELRNRWRELGPQDLGARYALAELYALVPGRESERRSVLEEVIEIDPASAPAYAELAELALARGDRRASDSLMRRFVALEDDPARTRQRLAQLHELAGRWEEARRAYRELLELRPTDGTVLDRLARTYLLEDRPADARRELERHLRDGSPEVKAEARLLIADAWAWEGDFERALGAYREAEAAAREAGRPTREAEARRSALALEAALRGETTGSRLNPAIWTLLELGRGERALVVVESAETLFLRDTPRLDPLDYHVLLYAHSRALELTGAGEEAREGYAELVRRWGEVLGRLPRLADASTRLGEPRAD